jgi:hypothetical protein
MRRNRLKTEAGAANCRAVARVEQDPLPCIDVRLPVERQMVTELGDDDWRSARPSVSLYFGVE